MSLFRISCVCWSKLLKCWWFSFCYLCYSSFLYLFHDINDIKLEVIALITRTLLKNMLQSVFSLTIYKIKPFIHLRLALGETPHQLFRIFAPFLLCIERINLQEKISLFQNLLFRVLVSNNEKKKKKQFFLWSIMNLWRSGLIFYLNMPVFRANNLCFRFR